MMRVEDVQDPFQDLPDTVMVIPIPRGLVFRWSRQGIGFGELMLRAENGKLLLDTEHMSDEFALEVIRQAIEEGCYEL